MAQVRVDLLGVLSSLAGERRVSLEAATLQQAIETLAADKGEEFKTRLFDKNGEPRKFINIYVNARDYRFLNKLETELQDGDVISIIPAVSGG